MRQPLCPSCRDVGIILERLLLEQMIFEVDVRVCHCDRISGYRYKTGPNGVLSSTRRHPLPRGVPGSLPAGVRNVIKVLGSFHGNSPSKTPQAWMVWTAVINHAHHGRTFEIEPHTPRWRELRVSRLPGAFRRSVVLSSGPTAPPHLA